MGVKDAAQTRWESKSAPGTRRSVWSSNSLRIKMSGRYRNPMDGGTEGDARDAGGEAPREALGERCRRAGHLSAKLSELQTWGTRAWTCAGLRHQNNTLAFTMPPLRQTTRNTVDRLDKPSSYAASKVHSMRLNRTSSPAHKYYSSVDAVMFKPTTTTTTSARRHPISKTSWRTRPPSMSATC